MSARPVPITRSVMITLVAWPVLGFVFTCAEVPAADVPQRGLKVVVALDAPPPVRRAAQQVLAAVPKHALLIVLAGDKRPTQLTDSRQLAKGPPGERAFDHLLLIGLPDDPMISAAWQREARVTADGWYVFGFGHLRGELGYIESDRNPLLHAAAIARTPYETEVVTLTGSTPAGVERAVAAFLERGLINGIVAAPGWQRSKPSLLERDPLPPDFVSPALAPEQAGSLRRIGVTQAAEDEYRGVLEDTGTMPKAIWRWKYHRPGVWDGAGEVKALEHYAAGLHRRAFGNSLWAAEFSSAQEAVQAAAKIAARARLKRQGDAWDGLQPPYEPGKESPGPLVLWQSRAWLLMSTLPAEATAAIRRQ